MMARKTTPKKPLAPIQKATILVTALERLLCKNKEAGMHGTNRSNLIEELSYQMMYLPDHRVKKIDGAIKKWFKEIQAT